MTPTLRNQLTVEHALAHGLPLAEELEQIAPRREKDEALVRAISAARAGDLTSALLALRVDRVVAAAIQLEPRAARDVGDRLRRAPRPLSLLAPVAAPILYLSALLIAEALIALLLTWKVLPSLELDASNSGIRIVGGHNAFAAAGIAAAAVPLLWASIALFFQVRFSGDALQRPFDGIRAARLFAAAEGLALHGVAPAASLPRLSGAARVPEESVAALAGSNSLDAATCGELSRFLSARALRRARHLGVATRVIGGVLTATIAFLLIGSVYLTLVRVSGSQVFLP